MTSTIKRPLLISICTFISFLTSCSYPRLLNFPFDPGGRGLNSPAAEFNPHVASRYIVFISDRNGSQDVYLYDAVEKVLIDLPRINALNEIASDPSISEDGRYIVFAASRQGRADIFIYDRQTEQKRNISQDIKGEVRHPTISADGSRIAFEVGRDGQWDIWVGDRSGKPLYLP
ncbi:MAG: TolB family protein [Prochloron sp. SP5CPC1]|nr:TolB family protein [Candidatus Paraprochloron terpiosi SP5CPC1]